jgi:glycosyltransferase involved in cell wall biosynthesis
VDASIVIPTYNRLDHLKSTLESLKALDFPRGLFEVVVVNDGSGDGTGSFLSKAQFDFQVRVLRHERNRGRAAARNTGVRQARGRIVVFLDDDMEVAPGFLEAHLCKQGEGAKRVVIGNVSSSPKVTQTALIRYLDTRGVHKLKLGQSVPFRYFTTGNVSVERDLLLDVGLFDERFHEWGGEDLELGYRLSKAGADFAYVSEARSYQTDYREIPEFWAIIETYGECSLPIIVEKHPELKPLFKIHLLEPVFVISEPFVLSIKKVLFRLALWKPWRAIIAFLISVFNRLFVPAILFDYLILFYCLRGFKKFWQK